MVGRGGEDPQEEELKTFFLLQLVQDWETPARWWQSGRVISCNTVSFVS